MVVIDDIFIEVLSNFFDCDLRILNSYKVQLLEDEDWEHYYHNWLLC